MAVTDLQATGDTRGARRRSSLSYEPSAAPHLNPLRHSTRERLSKRGREITVAISIAICWLCKSARLHGHWPSSSPPVRTHVHAIAHVHAWRGEPNERSAGCTLQCTVTGLTGNVQFSNSAECSLA